MKPFPRSQSLVDRDKAVFNYRLSRTRRTVENAFGILTHRFRIFSMPINLNVDTIENLVTTACILHNLLAEEQISDNSFQEIPPTELPAIDNFDEDEFSLNEPYEIRNIFKDYFIDVGSVPWQNDTIRL